MNFGFYSISYAINTGLSARVGRLNPPWNRQEMDETVCVYFLFSK